MIKGDIMKNVLLEIKSKTTTENGIIKAFMRDTDMFGMDEEEFIEHIKKCIEEHSIEAYGKTIKMYKL